MFILKKSIATSNKIAEIKKRKAAGVDNSDIPIIREYIDKRKVTDGRL